MANMGERLESIRGLRMWTQARLAKEAGVSPTTVSAIETGKIGRPHFGTIGKLAGALRVAPEELQGSRAAMEGPRPLSMGWARDSEDESAGSSALPPKPRLLISRAGRGAATPSEALWGISRGQ